MVIKALLTLAVIRRQVVLEVLDNRLLRLAWLVITRIYYAMAGIQHADLACAVIMHAFGD
jgi:hypothetical protein